MQGGAGVDVATFIAALSSPTNEVREAAEKQLDDFIKNRPWFLVENVLQAINSNSLGNDALRYSFVVLKHVFSEISEYSNSKNKRKFANALNGVDLAKYGQLLLNFLVLISKQPDSDLRMNVIRCVSSYAEIILIQSQWPLLVQTLNNLMAGDVEAQTVCALTYEEISSLSLKPLMNIAGSIVEVLGNVSSRPMHTYKASVLATFIKVYSNLIISVSTKSQEYKVLCGMIGIYWNFLQAALEEGDTESCSEIMSSVVLMVQCRNKLCNEELLRGFSLMANIITSGPQLPISLKKSAATLFSMFATSFTKQLFYPRAGMSPHSSPSKKRVQIINTDVNANLANVERVIEVLVTWCSDIPDYEKWITENPEEDDSEDENKYKPDGTKYLYRVGQDMLDTLAVALGYKIMFGMLRNLTPRLLISPEWTARSTACIMYCICVEGLGAVPENLENIKEANETLKNEDIVQICQWVCSLADDPHPRVRWAVAQTLGQMCTDLSPKVQQLCGKLVVETLLKLMDDAPSPNVDMSSVANCKYSNPAAYFARPSFRVVAHSAGSLGSFYSESKITESVAGAQNYVVASIEASLDKISRLMSSPNLLIQKQCITTLGSIANTSSSFFVSKYNLFIGPCLAQLQRYLSGELTEPVSQRPFAHQLIETISLIGHAVGPEVFKNDGIRFMNMLINYKIVGEGCLSNQPLLRSALFKAMSNVNNSMGRYLQQDHINALMLTICDTLKSDVTAISLVDPEEDDDEDDEANGEYEVYNIGGARMRYNTSVIEEVEDASELLELLIGDHFIETSPFFNTILEQSLKILQSESLTMTEFALSNILFIVRAIKHLIKCIQHPEKNETGLAVTVTMDDIKGLQQNIYTAILPQIVKMLPDFDNEINSSATCINILRTFIFSAPQYLVGADQMQVKNTLEEYYIKPVLMSYKAVTEYFKEIIDNEEGDYGDQYAMEEKENYSNYTEVIGLAIASGFSFMVKYPNFNFIEIYNNHFNEIVNNLLTGMTKEEREDYCDVRSAGCIVGQNIVKLPENVINSVPILKQTLGNVVLTSLTILSESLTVKGSTADVILPPSSYPTVQSGYYTLKCIISRSQNISITTEIFEFVAKQNSMGGAWEVLDFIVDCCMKFTKLCVSGGGVLTQTYRLPMTMPAAAGSLALCSAPRGTPSISSTVLRPCTESARTQWR